MKSSPSIIRDHANRVWKDLIVMEIKTELLSLDIAEIYAGSFIFVSLNQVLSEGL